MANVLQQPGLLSKLMYAKETTPGVVVSPTDFLDAETFVVTDDPQIIEYPVMRRSRNVIGQTRAGIHKIGATTTSPLQVIQQGALWTGLIGHDNLNTAAITITTTADSAPGSNAITVASLAALPSGVTEFTGLWVHIGAGGTLEKKVILGTTATTYKVSPLKYDHPSGDPCTIPIQHIIQENLSPNQAILQTYSLYAQFAEMYEWQLPWSYVSKGGVKGDSKTLKSDFSFDCGELPITPGSLTAAVSNTAEHNDSPLIMRDGGLMTRYSPSDPLPVMHGRIVALDWSVDNGMIMREYGGGLQDTMFNVPGERKQKLTWKEDAGQNNATPDIYTNYVLTQQPLEAFLAYVNALSGVEFSAWFPYCTVNKYDPVNAMNEPVGYDGEITPLEDGTSGKSVKICIVNGVLTPY